MRDKDAGRKGEKEREREREREIEKEAMAACLSRHSGHSSKGRYLATWA